MRSPVRSVLRSVSEVAMSNAYALGRNSSTAYIGVEQEPEYADADIQSYAAPSLSNENGMIDNPASAGAPRSTSGDGSNWPASHGGSETVQYGSSGTGTMAENGASAVNATSAQRIQAIPLYDRHNNSGPPDQFWEGGAPLEQKGAGTAGTPSKSRSISGGEELHADNFYTDKGINPGDRRWADNPRLNVPNEPRPTSGQSPSDFKFMRPFDQLNRPYDDVVVGSSRHLTGMHFSMADHRREYEILGMAPAKTGRNTYRLTPEPWDEHIEDLPPAYSQVNARVEVVDIPSRGRTWRL